MNLLQGWWEDGLAGSWRDLDLPCPDTVTSAIACGERVTKHGRSFFAVGLDLGQKAMALVAMDFDFPAAGELCGRTVDVVAKIGIFEVPGRRIVGDDVTGNLGHVAETSVEIRVGLHLFALAATKENASVPPNRMGGVLCKALERERGGIGECSHGLLRPGKPEVV